MQFAAREALKNSSSYFLEYGAEVSSPPAKEYGATAFSSQPHNGIAYILLEYEAVVNASPSPPADFDGRTALEGAAEHERVDVVQILLLLNVGCLIAGDGQERYKRALERNSENGHHTVRRLLERHHSQYYVD